jgi:hypothetical protein
VGAGIMGAGMFGLHSFPRRSGLGGLVGGPASLRHPGLRPDQHRTAPADPDALTPVTTKATATGRGLRRGRAPRGGGRSNSRGRHAPAGSAACWRPRPTTTAPATSTSAESGSETGRAGRRLLWFNRGCAAPPRSAASQ